MKNNNLKGVFAVTAGVALAASMQTAVALADDNISSPVSGCVTADVLNIRMNPNTASSVIGTLTYNTNITVLEINNGWYKINYNGTTGWVYGEYVSLSSNPPAPSARANYGQGKVTADALNFRSGPGTGYSIIGELYYGQAVDVISADGGWCHINYNGTTGYVSSDYVEISSSASERSNQSSSSSSYLFEGTVDATALNLREDGSKTSPVIATLYYGQKVNVIASYGSWYKINCNGTVGFVWSDYITKDTTSSAPASSDTSSSASYLFEGTVDADALNLREDGSKSSPVIATLYYGQKVNVIASYGSWYKINCNGTVGFVWSDYITEDNTSSEPAPSESPSSESYLFEGTVDADALNLREDGSKTSPVIATLYYGQKVNVIASYGSWYKVNYNGTTGFVWSDYIVNNSGQQSPAPSEPAYQGITGKVAIVTATALNVRSGAGTEHSILGVVRYGSRLPIISYYSGWYKVQFGSEEGYISADYVTVVNENEASSAIVRQTPLVDCDYTGEQIAEKAKEYLGVPYVWGGFTPLGFDCSGLVQYVYRQCGVSIERTTYYQVHEGQIVSKDNLQPGDLIFFTTNQDDPNDVSHVGMYVGNDMFIHAPKPGDIVRISNLNSAYYTNAYYVAKRIIK